MEKTTDLSQITDKLYHIMLYTSPWSRFELITSLVIGTDCIGSCKSNYHTTTTVPGLYNRLYVDIKFIWKYWKMNSNSWQDGLFHGTKWRENYQCSCVWSRIIVSTLTFVKRWLYIWKACKSSFIVMVSLFGNTERWIQNLDRTDFFTEQNGEKIISVLVFDVKLFFS